MTNPYAPPPTESTTESFRQANRLFYIWIWLPIAVLGAMTSCPADVIAIALAWAFALACFLCGVILASDLNSKPRWVVFGLFFFIAAALAGLTTHSLVPIYIAIESVFAITNGVLGFMAGRSVVHERLRIFGALSISYSLGLVLGPLGVILLTVPIVLVTNRNVASDAH